MRDHPAFHQDFEVQGGDFTRAGEVSCLIKNLLKELGISAVIVRRVAIASFEAEMNVIMYAVRGTVGLTVTPSQIQIVVDDQGPGIPDIEQAMTEGFSTATPEMRERGSEPVWACRTSGRTPTRSASSRTWGPERGSRSRLP